jgi:uncharacterized membrane protein YecN with MAPEG domain
MSGAGGWIAWVAIMVTVARLLHAAGMLVTVSFAGPPHPLRAIGAIATVAGGIALGVALLLRAAL